MRWLPSLLLLAGACEGGSTAPPRLEDLTRRFGCADVVFVAGGTEGRTAYFVASTDGLLEEATAAGAVQTTMFALPDARVRMELVTGRSLTEPCDDVVFDERIDAVYRPVDGTAIFTITPPSAPPPEAFGHGTLELRGVTLESEDSDHVVDLDGFVIERAALGWLPG
jgi:hypothetical protein